jgi:hypothetical protein
MSDSRSPSTQGNIAADDINAISHVAPHNITMTNNITQTYQPDRPGSASPLLPLIKEE